MSAGGYTAQCWYPWRPSGALTLLMVFVLGFAGQAMTSPAADASDGRPVDVAGEVTAYYQHFLGRVPDGPGMLHYLQAISLDCRGGVRGAGWAIANSGEASAFLRQNDRRSNSIYVGFRQRIPDAGG